MSFPTIQSLSSCQRVHTIIMLWTRFASLLLIFTQTLAEHRRKVIGCEGKNVNLFCEDEKVIQIVRANFGRISSRICAAGSRAGVFDVSSSWSTRCIQPTSLRAVTSACRGQRSHCSVEVSSAVFGDPCPGTPKYLEVVYTCQRKSSVEESPSIPEWILQIKSLPKIITETTTMTPTSRNTPKTTTESVQHQLVVVTEKLSPELPKSRFPESLPLMNDQATDELETDQIFINQPKSTGKSSPQNIFEDSRILPAVIVTSICVFIIGVIGVYLVLHRQDSDTASDQYTIVKMDPSLSMYHSQVYNTLSKGHVYQMPSSHYKSSQSVDQSHYYQIV